MATQVSSFLLSDGDVTFRTVMKLAMSNRSKWEIVTMGRCLKKCGDDECVPCNASIVDPCHAFNEWDPVPHKGQNMVNCFF
jgi:hypothetical protein